MDNNNENFNNGGYNFEPQRPFTEKNSEPDISPVQNEPKEFFQSETQNMSNANDTDDIKQNPAQNFAEPINENANNQAFQNNCPYPDNRQYQNPAGYGVPNMPQGNTQSRPDVNDYTNPQQNIPGGYGSQYNYNDYSTPVYTGGNQYQQQPPYGQPYPYAQPQPNRGVGYNPAYNVPPVNRMPYPYPVTAPKPQKKKAGAGLTAIIVVLCVLLAGSLIFLGAYAASNIGNNSSYSDGSDYTVPGKPDFTLPQNDSSEPAISHDESDYSSKVKPDFGGIKLESKPKDASTNKNYTSEFAYNKVSDSVVGIVCYSDEVTSVEKCASQGSGIIITSDGYVVTNAHVINNSKTAYIVQIITADGKTYDAGVVGFDTRTDIAVLKMDNAKNLKAASFGNSDSIELGEDIIVVGNPGGLDYQNSITKGIVSAVNRSLSSSSLVKYIQTDAAINPGNSGGPLVNMYGQVIGIATSKIVSEKYEGMGFAIPSATAKGIIDSLMKNGYIEGRVKIGITGMAITSQIASDYNVPEGIYIQEIDKNGPCGNTELKENDIITQFDGNDIKSFSDIYEILEEHKPGDKVKLKYYRMSDGSKGEIEITLQEDK